MVPRLLKLCVSLLYYLVYEVGLARICANPHFPAFTVLTYHSIKDGQLKRFEKQMDDLLKIGRPTAAGVDGSMLSGRRNIAVTFDDGFQSFLKNAVPALRERRIPATIFVPTGDIGKKASWIRDPHHMNAGEEVLKEKQLRELAGDLITIGSHSVTHARLSELDEKEAMKEVMESKKRLEDILGRGVGLFSFPYGDYNEEIIRFCIQSGYQIVFTNIPRQGTLENWGNVYGRIDLSLDDWRIEYRLKMLGAYQWLSLAIKIKRRLRDLIESIRTKIRVEE